MTITSHKIQTVLKTYDKQLRLGQMYKRGEKKEEKKTEDLVHISPEGKNKQQISELVAIRDKETQITKTALHKDE